jgi:hypothetical protein
MDITLLASLITYLVFGSLGYLWGKRLPLPARTVNWVLWLILLVLSDSLFVQVRLVDIYDFAIYLNWVIQALVVGILINFVVRTTRPEKPQVDLSGTTKP